MAFCPDCNKCIHSRNDMCIDANTYNSEGCKHFENENHFAELPCDVGEKIYQIIDDKINVFEVCSIVWLKNKWGENVYINVKLVSNTDTSSCGLKQSTITFRYGEWKNNSTVFFNQDAAEKALDEK